MKTPKSQQSGGDILVAHINEIHEMNDLKDDH